MAIDFFNYLDIKDAKIIRCGIDDLGLAEKRAKNTYLDASKFIRETDFKFTELKDVYEIIRKTNAE